MRAVAFEQAAKAKAQHYSYSMLAHRLPGVRTVASKLLRLKHFTTPRVCLHTDFLLCALWLACARPQVLVKAAACDVFDMAPEAIHSGLDGCSAPAFAMPLHNAALGFARLCLCSRDPSSGKAACTPHAQHHVRTHNSHIRTHTYLCV